MAELEPKPRMLPLLLGNETHYRSMTLQVMDTHNWIRSGKEKKRQP